MIDKSKTAFNKQIRDFYKAQRKRHPLVMKITDTETNYFIYVVVGGTKTPTKRKREIVEVLEGRVTIKRNGEPFNVHESWKPFVGRTDKLVFELYKGCGRVV